MDFDMTNIMTTKEHLNWTADLLDKTADILRDNPSADAVHDIVDVMSDFQAVLRLMEHRIRRGQ